jgi:hypothetical protein
LAAMSKNPKQDDRKIEPEGDPKRGDTLLKRMLKTPPKPHKEMKKGKPSKGADKKERPSS